MRNYCCQRNTTIRAFCIVDAYVAVNNTSVSVATEIQQWAPFALLSRYKIFRTAVNTTNVLRSICKVNVIFERF